MSTTSGTAPGAGARGTDPTAATEAAAAALPAPTVRVLGDLAAAAPLAAQDTAEHLAGAVSARGVAHLALTGGSAGQALADLLAQVLPRRLGAGLGAVHVWLGDERFVPAGDPERNDLLAAGLLDAGLGAGNLHAVRGPERVADVEASARALEADLDRWLGPPGTGRLDVVHLGLGPDAHVCSLFPGHRAALAQGTRAVAVRDSPKPPGQRVSLTFTALQAARCVMVVAGGAAKARAAALGLGRPDVRRAPASCGRGRQTRWYLDEAAASLLR